MSNLPDFWGPSNANLVRDSHREDEQMTPRADMADNGIRSRIDNPMPSAGGNSLLNAVSTLLALTPQGRTDELARLTALAHGYIPLASEDQLVALAKAVAGRGDISSDLADRLSEKGGRAAHTLIRANRLSDEAIARLLETGDQETRALIARHHKLHGKHITMLVADGNGAVLQALLENHKTDFSADTQKLVQRQVEDLAKPKASPAPLEPQADLANDADLTPSVDDSFETLRAQWSSAIDESAKIRKTVAANPRDEARRFAELDEAGRRAVMHRIRDDRAGTTSLMDARRALDPTRHDADLAFLTVIEQRDPSALASLFASTLELDPTLVTKLLDEADGEALLVLSKAVGLSSTAFARMLILGKTGMTGSPRDTFALVDRFNALPASAADLIVSAMREGTSKHVSQPTPSARTGKRRALDQTGVQSSPVTGKSTAQKTKSITTLVNQGFRRAV